MISLQEHSLALGIRCFIANGERYMASLPSKLCYCIPEFERHGKKADRQSLPFFMEGDVPIDAEAMSYALVEAENSTMAIVVDGSLIAEILAQAAELKGLSCLAITPEALLAVECLKLREVESGVVVFPGEEGCDMIEIKSGKPARWEWISNEPERLIQLVAEKMQCNSDCPELKLILTEECPIELSFLESGLAGKSWLDWSKDDWLQAKAADILTGKEAPMANFTSGALDFVDALAPARSTGAGFLASAVLLMIMVTAGLYWRGRLYQGEILALTSQQEEIYQELFPGQAIPVGMMSRMESEYRRLAATRDKSQVPIIGDALPLMRAFFCSLPSDARFHAKIIHFVPKRLQRIEGMAKSYADLEVLRTSLISSGFDVPPVSATKSSSGVTLRWEQVNWNNPNANDQGSAQ